MKQKLFTLLTLLVLCVTGAWAQTYTNENATVTWAFTNASVLTSTNEPADAFLTTNFSQGSNLNASSVTRNGKNNAWGQDYNMVAFTPTATVAKNTGETAANTLTFTITPATGITFTPENISLTGCNYGGTGDPKTNIYVKYSDDTTESLQSGLTMIRDDKKATESGGGSSPSILSYDLEHAVDGAFTLKIWMDGLTNTSKGVAFTNIVITGKVSGTPVATTTYTITAATNDASLGIVAGTATVAENEEVTLTATPTVAGNFIKWQKGGADFAGNTANPLTVTATADATYTAVFEAKKAITFAKGEGTGTVPSTDYIVSGENYTIPEVFFLYKSGATLTGWNDGSNTYAPGTTISNVTTDIALTAVFTDNTVNLGDESATVNWTFARSAGAPTISCENSETDYVQHTIISDTRFDVVMHVNTVKNAVIDGKTGKLNNTNNSSNAQVNAGTKFTIPVIPGSVITYNGTNGTASTGDITFGGNNGSVSGAVTTYTYSGATGTLDIVDTKGGFYPSGINVTYPEPKTKYDAPTITVGDFNFENKGYEVTITASEGDLYVAEDGNDFIAKASPYTTYATATTHYYAQAKGSDYGDSDVADEQVENAFDGTKAYVAWVYESDYVNKPNNYNIANDDIYKGLVAEYNVVLVDIKDYKSAITDEQKAALNGNLDDADLVVLSEAAAGASKAVIAMKDLVGTVPMLNMKLFSYSSDRWDWGTPKNLGTDVADVTITPVSKYYKVLEGVTFDGNNVALFSYPNANQNHIQYVDSWTAEPAGDVVLANVTVSEANKPAMHASTTQKYFALGLSCDDFGKYNANVVTLIKNAAAMLIAGEDLAAVTAVEGTIKANKEWITFCSTENLDFSSDITGLDGAYTITAHADKATTLTATKMTGAVKAGTGLLLRAAEKKDVDQVIAIPVAATGAEQTDNMLIGVTEDTDIQPTAGDYTHLGLSNGEFHPYSEAGTLSAGKAYLRILTAQMPTAGNNAKLIIVFDGEATGIANLNVNDNDNIDANAPMYNLAGQRVNKSYKGVVIVNGKKVVRK